MKGQGRGLTICILCSCRLAVIGFAIEPIFIQLSRSQLRLRNYHVGSVFLDALADFI